MNQKPPSSEIPSAENASLPKVKLDEINTFQESPLKARLLELFLVTLKIGMTSFGAPTAHIAMMENEFVRKRKWITECQRDLLPCWLYPRWLSRFVCRWVWFYRPSFCFQPAFRMDLYELWQFAADRRYFLLS